MAWNTITDAVSNLRLYRI